MLNMGRLHPRFHFYINEEMQMNFHEYLVKSSGELDIILKRFNLVYESIIVDGDVIFPNIVYVVFVNGTYQMKVINQSVLSYYVRCLDDNWI